MNKLHWTVLILVVTVSFFLRFYNITSIPPSLNWDEVSIGYSAYSILKTGRDEWNNLLPLHFKAYGEYKLPAQIYFSIPGIYIFGLNEFGVRITPVIYGTLTVLLMFFLVREIFRNNTVGLLSAFLLGISPWHIHLTRASFESSFSVFWIVFAIWLLLKGFRDSKWLVFSMIPFAISIYTYNSARLFSPLFLITVLLIYFNQLKRFKRSICLSFLIFVIFMAPLIPFFLSGGGKARYKLVSVTDDPGLALRVNENRGLSTLPTPLPRLVHNKITYTVISLGEHYFVHFAPDFLFISGAPHKQHHVQDIGELYMFQAPFLLFGLYILIFKKQKFRWLIIAWMLLAYVPVSVTNDSIPHALRTLIAVPTYQLISALGIYHFLKRWSKTYQLAAIFILIVWVCINISSYLRNYYLIYPFKYSRDWQYGYKQVVDYMREHIDQYDEVVFTRHRGEPHMFTLFFLNYDPYRYQNDPNLVRFETYDWVRVLRFDKFYFPDLGDKGTQYKDVIKSEPGKKLLIIGKPGDFPKDAPILKTVKFLDNSEAFEITEVK